MGEVDQYYYAKLPPKSVIKECDDEVMETLYEACLGIRKVGTIGDMAI